MATFDAALLAGFTATAAAIVVSPGPDTMVILRCALATGRSRGLAAVAGVQSGLVVHTLLAAFGISALIAASPPLLKGIALAGAVYLAWLGMRSMMSETALFPRPAAARTTLWRAAREAMLTNLLNPKVLVLFLALYPNFISPDAGQVTKQIVVLSAILIGINAGWQAMLAWSADRAKRWLASPAIVRGLNLAVGAALIGFALVLVIEQL